MRAKESTLADFTAGGELRPALKILYFVKPLYTITVELQHIIFDKYASRVYHIVGLLLSRRK